MTTAELLQSYYTGLNNKDDSWQQNLADDATFTGGTATLNAQGKDGFIASFKAFLGAVENLSVKQMIIAGDNAYAVITCHYLSPTEDRMVEDVAEVWHIKNNQLASLTIYFNISGYRKFMGR